MASTQPKTKKAKKTRKPGPPTKAAMAKGGRKSRPASQPKRRGRR